MIIDKNKYDPEELKEFERLIAKGMVAQEEPGAQVSAGSNTEKVEPMKKSAEPEVPQFVKDAIAKSEEFIEGVQKKEMVEVAKKYEILGQKPEELGAQLYDLKKSNEKMYNTCISMLDGQLALIEKSPTFAEFGKSGHRGNPVAGGSAEDKIEAKAREIMKADPHISHTDAVAKAWFENPDLADEYDSEYFGK